MEIAVKGTYPRENQVRDTTPSNKAERSKRKQPMNEDVFGVKPPGQTNERSAEVTNRRAGSVRIRPLETLAETRTRIVETMQCIPGAPVGDIAHTFGMIHMPSEDPGALFPGAAGMSVEDLRRAYAIRHSLVEIRPESFQIFETKLEEKSADAGYIYNHQMAVVGVFTKKNTGEPVGYFLDLIYDDFHGERYAEHLYLFLDRTQSETDGTATAHLRSQDKAMDKLGIDSELICAWYIGRWVWAKPQHKYKFTGTLDKVVMQKSLKKFLKAHNIDKDDLRIQHPDGGLRKMKIKKLKSPADFAAITTKDPATIRVRIKVGSGGEEEVELPLNKGFLLAVDTPNWKGVRRRKK